MKGLERSLEVDGHPCPFDKLPTEIVEDIFSSACTDVYLPTSTKDKGPALLTLVCKTWFDIATHHHSLWATFTIETSHLRSGFSSGLCTYLQKSSACPLRIAVLSGGNENILGVLDAIICHSERWERIALSFPLQIQFLRKLNAVQDRLPLLQHLRITGPKDQYWPGTQHSNIFNLRNAPLLTHISLGDMHSSTVHTLELPWTQLSRVVLDFISFRTVRSRLSLSQHLMILRLNADPYQWMLHQHDHDDNKAPPTPLQNLEELQINDMIGVMNIADLICPSLKILLLKPPRLSHVLTFLNNSSCRLIDLVFTGDIVHYSCDLSEIRSIIQHPSLENLRSLSLTAYYLDIAILDILILDDAQNTLPFLETLCMDMKFDWYDHSDFESRINGMRRMVESRAHGKRADGSSPKNHTGDVGTHVNTFFKKFTLTLKVDIFKWSEYVQKWSEREDMQLEEFRSDLRLRNIDQTVRVRNYCAR